MPTIYCSKSGCGAKIEYSITKPKTCPKCSQEFSSAFKVVPVVASEDEYEEVVIRRKKSTAPSPASIPPRRKSKLVNPNITAMINQDDEEDTLEQEEDATNQPLTQDEIDAQFENRSYTMNQEDSSYNIEELRSSIEENIIINASIARPEKFSDILRENESKKKKKKK